MEYAVITGSTKGIGKATAKLFLEKGYSVIINYAMDDESAEQVKSEFAQYKDRMYIIKQTLENYQDVCNFCDRCYEITNELSVIVSNTGTTDKTSWEDMSWDAWQRVMNVNLNAPAFVAQLLGKRLKPGGSIVFVGSAMGIHPHAISIPYGVSKSALHFLAKSLVKEYETKGVRVNAIAPGFVDTSWQKNKPQELRKKIEAKISLSRFADEKEIADAIWFLVSNIYMNGSLLTIDGGYLNK